jgi:RNA polymerase sigma-70 factor (ECF subfamily)
VTPDLPDATLQHLLTRVGERDEQAFARLYRHYNRRVFAYVMHLHAHAADADEITHDVFLALARQPQAYLGQSRFSTWLLAMAKYKVIDLWRKQGREPLTVDDDGSSLCQLSDPLSDPVDQAIAWEDAQALDRCRDALPLPQKEALFMAYYQGASVSEIAEHQQCPAGTVKSRLHKARLGLQQCLKRWHEGGRP